MKKVAYLTMMFVALALMSFSCCKDDDDPIVQTLEEQYPEWSDLYGQAPANVEGIPTITITIVENVGTIEQFLPQISNYNPTYLDNFDKVVISGSTVTLKNGESVVASGTFTKSGSQVLPLTTSGLATAQYSATYTF